MAPSGAFGSARQHTSQRKGVNLAGPAIWLASATSWQVVADVLWTALALSILANVIGVLAVRHGRWRLALILLLMSTVATLYFSLLGGLSIGRFTALLPALTIAYALSIGTGARGTMAFLAAGFLVYAAASWLLTPLEFDGVVFAWLLGGWAIGGYALAALVAFPLTAVRLGRRRPIVTRIRPRASGPHGMTTDGF